MSITKQTDLKWYQQALSIIAGACLMGFMWRIRGNHGFGAKWGMFAVAFVFMLFIYALYGNRKKMNYEMMPLCAVFAALTAGGWGTLNSQMNGYLSSSANFVGEEVYRYVEISEYSGLAIMLLLGFGWLPLFAIFFSSLFSERKYEFKDCLVFIGVYYVTMLVANLTVSHYILGIINPEAVEACREGLIDAGHDMTPMKAFITQFGSAPWAKKIPFCRNYFTSVKVISSAIGALASVLSVAVVLKDKFTAVASFLINLSCAVAITLADCSLILDSDRGFLKGINTPGFLSDSAWATWEFFTGFILGFLIMLIITLLPKKYTASESEFIYTPLIKNNKLNFIYNGILTLFFSFVVILARAFSFRLNELTSDSDAFEIILTVVLSVALFYPVIKTARKNILEKNLNKPIDLTPQEFAVKILPDYLLIICLVYFLLGEPENTIFSINLLNIISVDGFLNNWNSGKLFEPLFMLASFIVFNISFKIIVGKKLKINNKSSTAIQQSS